jgi:Flp pilus assembly secretin CpaC
MDMPGLGFLFRTDVDSTQRTELLITITPSVVRNREEAREVTDDYTERIRGLAAMRRAMQTQRLRDRAARRTLEFPAGSTMRLPEPPASDTSARPTAGGMAPADTGVEVPPELR